jgi:hypothetical protein
MRFEPTIEVRNTALWFQCLAAGLCLVADDRRALFITTEGLACAARPTLSASPSRRLLTRHRAAIPAIVGAPIGTRAYTPPVMPIPGSAPLRGAKNPTDPEG